MPTDYYRCPMPDELTPRQTAAQRPESIVEPDTQQRYAVNAPLAERRSDPVTERPAVFSEREGPTLASPNSDEMQASVPLEQRLVRAVDRITQLEADIEELAVRFNDLTTAFNAERKMGRSARLARYLLWSAIIAAMATVLMVLRSRMGMH